MGILGNGNSIPGLRIIYSMVTFNILFMNLIDPDNELRVLGNEMTCNLDKTDEEPALQCEIKNVTGKTQEETLLPRLPKLCSQAGDGGLF